MVGTAALDWVLSTTGVRHDEVDGLLAGAPPGLGDAELRRRMGERGREWVEEKWRWDLLAERLKALL
ncbi:hypothetical protein ABZ281_22600, partial [Streptomyces sp. NPDC006265]